jgi:hypothetical protein
MSIQGKDFIAFFTGGVLESIDRPSAPTVLGTPTELDTEFLEDVYEIIDEFGKVVTFWVYGSAVYDPTTGKEISGDATQYNLKVIPPYSIELRYVDGDLIKAGDMLSGVPAKDIEFTPAKGIKVTVDSYIWTIVRVQPIYSGEWICLYLFQLRR